MKTRRESIPRRPDFLNRPWAVYSTPPSMVREFEQKASQFVIRGYGSEGRLTPRIPCRLLVAKFPPKAFLCRGAPGNAHDPLASHSVRIARNQDIEVRLLAVAVQRSLSVRGQGLNFRTGVDL